ncbi:hypothetical protein HYZ64_03995 [Candidatus Berkelbacteria bacterium]|nr:hypothetical protein [Candidatus Berkelbacteria bacterium]
MLKFARKNRAINLREQGKSYREILQEVDVAKSTLSLWLRDVGLSRPQIQHLTEKKRNAALRGSQTRHRQRIEITSRIKQAAQNEIVKLTNRELWLMGIMLYWAEGSKEKDHHPGSRVTFTNSDPDMAKVFLKWLTEIVKIPENQILYSIYIHENHRERINKVKRYWAENLRRDLNFFDNVYYKKGNPKTTRNNIGADYFGLVRITVKASSSLNRKIAGWVEGIVHYYWGVV